MNKKINNFLFVFITVFLASCIAPTTQRTKPNEEAVAIEAEKQREIAVKEASKSHYRLLRVGGPILKKSLPFCKDRKRKSIGIIYANKFNYDENFQNIAVSKLGLDDTLEITYAIDSSLFQDSILHAVRRMGLRNHHDLHWLWVSHDVPQRPGLE